jgi:putative transposase
VRFERGALTLLRACALAGVSRSSFYYRARPRAEHSDRQRVVPRLHQLAERFPRYGWRRMQAQLRAEGMRLNHKPLRRLLREQGLSVRRRTRGCTVRTPEHRVYPNLYHRQPARAPNRIWVADLTQFWAGRQTAYLALVMDVYARRLIGWALSGSPDVQLSRRALDMALRRRRPKAGCLHHSDQGTTYTAPEYIRKLQRHGLVISMSRRAQPLDNAFMESLVATLKAEEIERRPYGSLEEARRALTRYLNHLYNRQRLHSALGYRTPCAFERQSNPEPTPAP